MGYRSVMPAPLQNGPDEGTTASTSQVLWHACRRDSPAVTAMLTSTATGAYEVQVAFGTVAVRRVMFSSAAAAVEAVERLLTQLEARGYQRQRRDKRTTVQPNRSHACAPRPGRLWGVLLRPWDRPGRRAGCL